MATRAAPLTTARIGRAKAQNRLGRVSVHGNRMETKTRYYGRDRISQAIVDMEKLQSLPVPADKTDRRTHPRRRISCDGEVRLGDLTVPCAVLDLSPAGAKLRVAETIEVETPVAIDLKGRGLHLGSVRWLDADLMGIGFAITPARHAPRERLTSRHELFLRGRIASAHGATDCRILDLSSRGACILMDEPIKHDTLLSLSVESFGEVRGQVAWQIHDLLGIAFFEQEMDLVQRVVPAQAARSPGV